MKNAENIVGIAREVRFANTRNENEFVLSARENLCGKAKESSFAVKPQKNLLERNLKRQDLIFLKKTRKQALTLNWIVTTRNLKLQWNLMESTITVLFPSFTKRKKN